MTRETYDVSFSQVGSFPSRKKDNSFASCVCMMLVILVICGLLLLLSFTVKKFSRENKENDDKVKPYERLLQYDNATDKNQKQEKSTKKHTNTKHEETTTHREILTTDSTVESDESISQSEEEASSNETSQYSVEHMGGEEPDTTQNVYSTIITSSVRSVPKIDASEATTQDSNSQEKETQAFITTTVSSAKENTTNDNIRQKIIGKEETTTGSTTEDTDMTTYREMSTTDSTVKKESEEEVTFISNTESETTSILTTSEESSTYQEKYTTHSNIKEKNSSTTSEGNTTISSIQYETTTLLTSTLETSSITEISSSEEIQDEPFKLTTITKNHSEEDPTNPTVTTETTTSQETTHVTKATEEISSSRTTHESQVSDSNSTRICRSTKCNLSVSRIITSMNLAEDRHCEDFFNFACGGISGSENYENLDIFESEVLENGSEIFLQDFKNFYRSCLNHEDVFRYRDRISKLNEVLIKEVYGYVDFEITDLLAHLVLLQAFPLLDIGIGVHPTNFSTFIITLNKPKYNPPDSTFWSSFSEYQRKCIRKLDVESFSDGLQLHHEYRSCMSNYSDYLKTMQTVEQDKKVFFNEEIDESFRNLSDTLEQYGKAFFNFYDSSEKHSSQFSEMLTIKKLQADFPALNWTRFFSLLTDEKNISENTSILISQIKYFDELMKKLSTQNRSMINLLRSMAEYIIYENIVLQSHVESRTEFCKEQTKYLMPDIANYLYKIIPNYHNLTENKIYIREIFHRLKQQFNESLEKSEWIGEVSRTQMQQKLERIQLFLFDNEDFEDARKILSTRYKKLMNEDEYSENLIVLLKKKKRSLLSLQGKDITAAKILRHLIDPDESLPVFFRTNGNAYIPYGFLRKASRELPEYLIQAQVGFPLARIIGQAFTPTEIDSEIKMNSDIYWNFLYDITSDHFPPKYFEMNDKNVSIGDFAKAQIDDMVADNIAMRLLTDSLKTFRNEPLLPLLHHDFSSDQIFYLQIAQEFCPKNDVMDVLMESFENQVLPPPIRLANVLKSSKEFSEHFSCSDGYHISQRQFPYIESPHQEGPLMNN